MNFENHVLSPLVQLESSNRGRPLNACQVQLVYYYSMSWQLLDLTIGIE